MEFQQPHHQHHQHHHHCEPITIVEKPICIERKVCKPQLVKVIHPIEVITKEECFPVYQHCYEYVDHKHQHHQHHHPQPQPYRQVGLSGKKR